MNVCDSDKSKRRTKAVKKTCEPKWNQTFVYTHVHRRDFRNHMLELTLWDQPRSPEEDSTFMGEVMHAPPYSRRNTAWLRLTPPPPQILIELETALLDDKPHWYPLQTHDVSSIPLPRPSPFLPRRHPQSDAPGKKLQRKCEPARVCASVVSYVCLSSLQEKEKSLCPCKRLLTQSFLS